MKTDPLPLPRCLATLALLGLSLVAVGCGGGDSTLPVNPGRGPEPLEETVELVLTARGLADLPLRVDARGVTTVDVGEEFTLELSYIDHRPQSARLGASQVFVDLLTDQANVLRPVIARDPAPGRG